MEAGTGIEPVFTDLQSEHGLLNLKGNLPVHFRNNPANMLATSEQEKKRWLMKLTRK